MNKTNDNKWSLTLATTLSLCGYSFYHNVIIRDIAIYHAVVTIIPTRKTIGEDR